MYSVTTECLYKSLFYKFFCTNLSQVVLRRFYTERFVYTICVSLFIYLFISYKSEEIELTDLLRIVSSTFKCYPHLNVEN